MTTNWQIFNTKYQTTDGLIIKVVYGCTTQLDDFMDRTIRELDLTGNPTSPGFIAYSDLTETTILEWVKSTLGTQAVLDIETSLQNSVISQKAEKDAETLKNGLPWRAS